jgi:hypothetical protein
MISYVEETEEYIQEVDKQACFATTLKGVGIMVWSPGERGYRRDVG